MLLVIWMLEFQELVVMDRRTDKTIPEASGVHRFGQGSHNEISNQSEHPFHNTVNFDVSYGRKCYEVHSRRR